MSAAEVLTEHPRRPRRRLWFTLLGLAAAIGILIGAAVLIRQTSDRLKAVEQRLASAETRSQAVLRQMNDYSRELDLALQRASESRLRADQSEALRTQAEANAMRSQGEAEHARSEAEQARAKAQEVRAQVDELRSRRKQELDRMREALNRIAPTRRTPLGMVVELANESFKFDFDKSDLRPENREMLSRIAGVLLASSGYRLDVYGHTDDIGTDEYNQKLSERRAQAVAGYLIKAGVPREIVSTRGYGKRSPRAQGATRAAREQNRRVEIGIVDTIINYQTQ